MQVINRPYRLMSTAALLLVGLIVSLLLSLLFGQSAKASDTVSQKNFVPYPPLSGWDKAFLEIYTLKEAAAPLSAASTVLYVNHAASGATHNGLSWETAYLTLQDALVVATAGQEIWVAAGTYYPDEGSGSTNNSSSASFALKNGVALYGGFDGTEVALDERDWFSNHTILSGDLTQNDPGKNSDNISLDPETMVAPNAYHVVTAVTIDDSALLDGFIITGGKADGGYTAPCGLNCGGGINLVTSTPQLRNLTLSGNFASNYGAALTAIDSTLSLEDSLLQGNRSANSGGALYLHKSGGHLIDVVISGNSTYTRGGALYAFQVSAPLTLTNMTFNGNRATFSGGAIYSVQSTMLLENTIVWGNGANAAAEVSNGSGAVTIFDHSLIKDAFPGGVWDSTLGTDGGNNRGFDPLFVTGIDPTTAPTLNGDLRLQTFSPAADGGDVAFNSSATDLIGADRLQGATIDIGAYESTHMAQLAIAKTVTPAVIEYGEPITYTVVLTNSGSAYAYATQLTDTLPAGVDFTTWLQQPNGATYQNGSHAIVWTADLAAPQVSTLQFVGTHNGGPDETITNTVNYSALSSSGAAQTTFDVLPLPIVDVADVTVDEANGSATFSVTLSATTRKPVVIDYITSDNSALAGADYTNTTATLTIVPGSPSGFITIPVNSDFIDEESEEFTITLTAAADGTLGDSTASATILDDDTAGTQVAPRVLTVDEPVGSATFTVTLDSQPVQPVVITLNNSDTSECFAPATVTVDESNWQQGIGIDVQAVDDFVVDGTQECIIQMSAASGDPNYHNIALDAVLVIVHSDDVAGIGVAPSSFAIGEQSEVGFFTVTLTSEPTATVTVNLASNDSSECSVPAQIALDAGNWKQGVGVPVTAQDDDLDDDNQLCTIQTTVTSPDANYDGRAMSDVPVTVIDDDTSGVAVSLTTLLTTEPSGQVSFGLSLTSEPFAPVTIKFTSQDTSECTVPTSITLDRNNWNVIVSILVSVVDDLIDDGNQLCVVQTDVVSADAAYQGVAAADVNVTVQDDGDTAGVILSKTALVVGEPTTTDSFVITLNSQPVTPVTINLVSQDSSECSVTSSVTLNATNWQQGKSVTVQAVDDESIDDTQSCVIQTTATSSDAPYNGIAVVDPVVTVSDNDYADILVGSPNVIVSEPNNSTIMILKLTSIPEAPVTIALASRDLTECNVPASVTLDSTNWKNGVGASVFAVNDDVDDDDQTCNVQATVTSADSHYHGLAVSDFPVTVVDDDSAGTVISPAVLVISEPEESAIFTIALTSEPTATVTLHWVSDDGSECVGPADATLDAGNWRAGVAVTVTAVDDAIDDEAQLCTVVTSTDSGDPKYQAIVSADLPVTVNDDDVAGVVVAPQQVVTGEPNGRTAFSVTLTSEPIAAVTVNLSSGDIGECSVPASVTLDATNWAIGVSVPVQAVDDRIDDADQLCAVETAVTSPDGKYAAIAAADVVATVQDDGDSAGILLSSIALTVSEPAGTAGFTVTLNSEPVAPVTIDLVPDDPSECSAIAVTLDATNWESGATVLVRAVDDHVDDGTQSCTLQSTAKSDDPLYEGMAIEAVAVTVKDEDVAGMIQSSVVVTAAEPSHSAFYTIALTSEPLAPVNVALTSADPTECSLPATVLLDATNWHAGVAVPVTAVDDHWVDGAQSCVVGSTITSADPLYQGGLLEPVVATIVDDDVAGFVIVSSTETINELDGRATFTVALTSEPTATVTISLVSLDRGECTAPTTVTIVPANWQTGASIVLAGVPDDVDDGAQSCIVTGIANSIDPHYDNLAMDALALTIADSNQALMAATLTANTTNAEIGDVVTYTYQVTNTGNVTLKVQAVDSALGAVTFGQRVLGPNDSANGLLTRVVQESDLPGPLLNSATITGRSPTGQILKANPTTSVVVAANPQLVVDVLRLGPPIVIPGTVVTFQVTITNVGQIDADVLAIQGDASTTAQAAAVVDNGCTAPLTILAGQFHRCTLLWAAIVSENDAVHYGVTVDARGLLNFTNSTSGEGIVVVSSPTSSGPQRIYLPLVNR